MADRGAAALAERLHAVHPHGRQFTMTDKDYDDMQAAAILGDRGLFLPDGAPHPGEPHEFQTTCLRCGEPGQLHVAVITPGETVTIKEAR